MIDWQTVIQMVDAELGHPTPTRAILAGLVCGGGLTQFLKFSPRMDQMNDFVHRHATRMIAFAAAFVPTAMLWPGSLSDAILMGATNGFFVPTAYMVVIRTAVHFAPWLESKVSARPAVTQAP